jgi:nucleoside-diphosphate-sugar epimerase
MLSGYASEREENSKRDEGKEKEMKVLIAGATGALGVPLVHALIASGHQVLGITRTTGKSGLLTTLGAQPIVADVMDRENLLRAIDGQRADAVVHALTALPKSGPMGHRDMYQTDALRDVGTSHLLTAAREVGAHMIVVEAMHVGYGFGNWGETILTEEQPFAPLGRSRELERHLAGLRSMEQQIFEATRAGWIAGISLRYGSFYGPESTAPLIDLLRRRSLPLPAGGQTFMSWIYIEDAAAAMVAALERGRAGQAYNIVDNEPVRWHDFMTELARVVGAPAPWSIPRWVLRPIAPFAEIIMAETSLHVSNARARSELDWVPSVPTYREGIQKIAHALGVVAPREADCVTARAEL